LESKSKYEYKGGETGLEITRPVLNLP
jgi:hypothetical protein